MGTEMIDKELSNLKIMMDLSANMLPTPYRESFAKLCVMMLQKYFQHNDKSSTDAYLFRNYIQNYSFALYDLFNLVKWNCTHFSDMKEYQKSLNKYLTEIEKLFVKYNLDFDKEPFEWKKEYETLSKEK